MHLLAHNPVMRYGLGELPSGHHSTLRERVSERMGNMGLTTGMLAKQAGVSPNTLQKLGSADQATTDRTLRKLMKPLGFTFEQLARWRAEDAARQHGVATDQWPPEIYRIAAKLMELDAEERQGILVMVDAYANKYIGNK